MAFCKLNSNFAAENKEIEINGNGKYKFIGITKTSKKGNYVITCKKYI